MLSKKVWRRLLAVDADTVVERVEFDEDADAVVALGAAPGAWPAGVWAVRTALGPL